MFRGKLTMAQAIVFATVILYVNIAHGQEQYSPPPRCACFVPDNANGANARCYSAGCSLGANNCKNGGHNVVFSYDFDSAVYNGVNDVDGCNCPGNTYTGGYSDGNNAAHNATPAYSYNDCQSFGANSNLDPAGAAAAAACCSYCCSSCPIFNDGD